VANVWYCVVRMASMLVVELTSALCQLKRLVELGKSALSQSPHSVCGEAVRKAACGRSTGEQEGSVHIGRVQRCGTDGVHMGHMCRMGRPAGAERRPAGAGAVCADELWAEGGQTWVACRWHARRDSCNRGSPENTNRGRATCMCREGKPYQYRILIVGGPRACAEVKSSKNEKSH
jgi:hypothetical protein